MYTFQTFVTKILKLADKKPGHENKHSVVFIKNFKSFFIDDHR